MSRLSAIATELRKYQQQEDESPADRDDASQAETIEGVEDDLPSADALARTAIDHVMSSLREEDDHTTFGDAVIVAASAIAKDTGADEDAVLNASIDFLFEAALAAGSHENAPLLVEGQDEQRRLHAVIRLRRSVEEAADALRKGKLEHAVRMLHSLSASATQIGQRVRRAAKASG